VGGGRLNRMEDMKLVKKITDWNLKGVGTRGRPKNMCRNEMINYLKEIKLRNWSKIVKDRKAWNDPVQIKRHVGLWFNNNNNNNNGFYDTV
jgi:hypothetical protein